MCKLFALSDTSGMTKTQLNALMVAVCSDFSLTQRDGFGFALRNPATKQSYFERYVSPFDFLGIDSLPKSVRDLGWLGEYARYSEYGVSGAWDKFELGGPLIAHGRTSTNKVNLTNTHPFEKEGWVLAHNGVVDWHGPTRPLQSSCDSEHLLNCYALGNGVTDFADMLSGWFATATIDPAGRLRVAKCASTDLHMAWSEAWKTYVFTTNRDLFARLGAALAAGFSRPLPLDPYVELVLNGNTCDDVVYFEAPPISISNTAAAATALGRPIAAHTATSNGFDKPDSPAEVVLKKKKKKGRRAKQITFDDIDWDSMSGGQIDAAIEYLQERQLELENEVEHPDPDPDPDPDTMSEPEWRRFREGIQAAQV